jgi:hypothetical protein
MTTRTAAVKTARPDLRRTRRPASKSDASGSAKNRADEIRITS